MSMAAVLIEEPMDPTTRIAYNRLVRALGPRVGAQVCDETLLAMGLPALSSQNDVLAFANILIEKGGAIESVGRALKISAILRGATED